MHKPHVSFLALIAVHRHYPASRAVYGNLPRLAPLLAIRYDDLGLAHIYARDAANSMAPYLSPPVDESILTSEEGLRAAEDFMHKTMVAPFN